jgi:hypothetical protein
LPVPLLLTILILATDEHGETRINTEEIRVNPWQKKIKMRIAKNTHLQDMKISVKFKKMIEKHMHLLVFEVERSCRYFLAVKGMLCKKF